MAARFFKKIVRQLTDKVFACNKKSVINVPESKVKKIPTKLFQKKNISYQIIDRFSLNFN